MIAYDLLINPCLKIYYFVRKTYVYHRHTFYVKVCFDSLECALSALNNWAWKAGRRRFTRDSQNRRLTRDSRFRPKIVFYRKTGIFHRKNDQEKISEIFVHLAPENTRKKRGFLK